MMIKISRLVFNIDNVSDFNLLESKDWILDYEGQLVIRRMENRDLSLSGDDLFVDGMFELDAALKLIEILGNPLAVRFTGGNMDTILRNISRASCYRARGNGEIFFGVFSVPLSLIKYVTGLNNSKEIFNLIFGSTRFLSQVKRLMVCKPKGAVYTRRDFVEVIFPSIPLIRLWDLINKWSREYFVIESNEVASIAEKTEGLEEIKRYRNEFSDIIIEEDINPLNACKSALSYSRVYE